MIGQERLFNRLQKLAIINKFPHFVIFVGPAGSGKKTLAGYIHKWLDNSVYTVRGITVDDVRQLIKDCNKLTGTTNICLIPDADSMSVQAKNALLKIAEEPPKDTYIIMTLEDINNTLETIKSRATVFMLDPYTVPQLVEYAQLKHYDNIDIIKDVCDTPGEVDMLCSYDVEEFNNFVKKTVNHIAGANGANAFKLAEKLKTKDDKDGYDMKLFFKMFMKICNDVYLQTNDRKFLQGVLVTSTYLKDLRIKGISKQGVIDLWILDIRKEWM